MWADNLLVLTISWRWADEWREAIIKECSVDEVNVVIKDPGIEVSQNQVSFLGIDWFMKNTTVMWRHVEKNVVRWRAVNLESKQVKVVAAVCGVLYWDNQLADKRLGDIREVWNYPEG